MTKILIALFIHDAMTGTAPTLSLDDMRMFLAFAVGGIAFSFLYVLGLRLTDYLVEKAWPGDAMKARRKWVEIVGWAISAVLSMTASAYLAFWAVPPMPFSK